MKEKKSKMIRAENINLSFRMENQKRLFGKERCQVLFDVSFEVKEGDCLGILGESGSGKSTLGRVLCGLLKPDKGEVLIDSFPMYKSRQKGQAVISVVFQDYTTSVNPRFQVDDMICESLRVRQKREGIKLKMDEEVERLLTLVGLDLSYKERYPHELSGGQLQRICIARALAVNPKIILFDEAISSLDSHTQVQVMDLLKEIQEKRKLTYVFVTHDLTSVTYLCNRVLFLYQGRVVEIKDVPGISEVSHPYAKKLLESVIRFD
jgi:nickel transport system ATP-binding protein